MRFSVTGQLTRKSPPVTVTWDDGRLEGPRAALDIIATVALAADGEGLGPVGGPYSVRNHLADPIGAAAIIERTFEPGARWMGDLPRRPKLPPGRIG